MRLNFIVNNHRVAVFLEEVSPDRSFRQNLVPYIVTDDGKSPKIYEFKITFLYARQSTCYFLFSRSSTTRIFNALICPTIMIVYDNATVRWLTRHLLSW